MLATSNRLPVHWQAAGAVSAATVEKPRGINCKEQLQCGRDAMCWRVLLPIVSDTGL